MNYTNNSNTATWSNTVIKQEIKQEPVDDITTKSTSSPLYNEDRKPGFIKQERNSFDSDFYRVNKVKKPDMTNIKQEPISSDCHTFRDTSIVKHEVDMYPVTRMEPCSAPQKIDSNFISWSNTPVIKIKDEFRDAVHHTEFGFTDIKQEREGDTSDDEIQILHVKIEPGKSFQRERGYIMIRVWLYVCPNKYIMLDLLIE